MNNRTIQMEEYVMIKWLIIMMLALTTAITGNMLPLLLAYIIMGTSEE